MRRIRAVCRMQVLLGLPAVPQQTMPDSAALVVGKLYGTWNARILTVLYSSYTDQCPLPPTPPVAAAMVYKQFEQVKAPSLTTVTGE